MDCTSILDELARVNYPSGNFVHDVIPPVIIDGKNTSFFIKAEQSTKNDNHIHLEMKLLDRNDHVMKNGKFFVELSQDDKIIHRDLFYTDSGTLVLDFDQNNSTKEITVDAEQANMGYFFSSNDHIAIKSPTLDGAYQIKVMVMGACDKMVFFLPQEAVPVFLGSFLVSNGHVNGVIVLNDDNQGIFGPPIIEIPKLLSPLQQFKSGVPIDEISCKEDLVLITKTSNENPACVKQETMQKLIERGWGSKPETIPNSKTLTAPLDKKYTVQVNGNVFEIRYLIIGSQLQEIIADPNSKSIVINVENSEKGQMSIEIPRKLIDARIGLDGKSGDDVDFFVLVDGSEVDFEETSSIVARTLTIPLENGSSQIEIIGTVGYPYSQ
ncbi:hypothetical protein [Candidatus Nitrosotenuis sp. DW1]|uniref:hypothetical protein n=1 Tax=Candidatus Nitrosotenuis sp. DW1 TaxID=2259672 RepID=UPI0015CD1736|nr:hypothetical protein [Candidatus Nitrosotenuis sp. DW1]